MKRPAGERFWEKVSEDGHDGCWLWTGAVHNTLPYGFFKDGSGRQVYAHRFAWTRWHGPIPPGLFVLHNCDNARCVNPDHLRLGTHADNMADRSERLRHSHGERHPDAKLSDDLVREIRRLRALGVGWGTLGKMFGVTPRAARLAALGKTWSHVT